MPDRIKSHAERLAPNVDRDYNRARSGDQAFYKTARWRKLRLVILNRDPICTVCGREVATEVDHTIDRLDRPDLELDPANLKGKCKPCHSHKTAQTTRTKFPGGPTSVHRLGD